MATKKTSELLSGGDMLIRALKDEGVRHVFGYPGGAALHIYDAIFRQKDVQQGIDERLRRMEPQKVMLDGREFLAEPDETRQYGEAVGVLRQGDFAGAVAAFSSFQRRWPASGYAPTALYWLGNAQYGKRDYKDAIVSFRALVAGTPDHPRVPEALLSIANCQIELKDNKAARRTLEELIKTHPSSEANAAIYISQSPFCDSFPPGHLNEAA